MSLEHMKQLGLKHLNSSFPTIHMKSLRMEENSFSSLDWQKKGIRYVCGRLGKAQEELEYMQ